MKTGKLLILATALMTIVGCKGGDGGRRWEDGCNEYKCGGPSGLPKAQNKSAAQVAEIYGVKIETVAILFEIEAGQNLDKNLSLLGINQREALMVAAGELEGTELIERVAQNLNESPAALALLYDDYVQNLE